MSMFSLSFFHLLCFLGPREGCRSQHMNRSQHASTGYHQSNLAVSLRSHSKCFAARRWPEAPRQRRSLAGLLLPHPEAGNLQLLAHWLFPERLTQGRSAWCSASHVRDRPASTAVDRLLLAPPQRSTPLPQHRRSRQGLPASRPSVA